MTHYDLVAKNKRNSLIVVTLFTLFIMGATYVMSQAFGYGLDMVGFALIFAGITSFGSYWFSDKIILTISGAREASRKEFFDFYTITENLCIGNRMKMPKLYVIDDTAMNAFATGRDPDHAVVCATTGILDRLNRSELEGVIAHELSHVINYDIRLMSVVTVLVGMIALLADWMLRMTSWGGRRRDNDREGGQLQLIFFVVGLILALLSPLIAQLIQLAISRNREFLADSSGVSMTKNPEGLAKALEKISQDTEPLEAANKATAHLYIENPLKNVHGGVGMFANLFATHPPVQERIKALRQWNGWALFAKLRLVSNTNSSVPVKHIAKLANIPVSDDEAAKLEKAFAETLEVVAQLREVDVKDVSPTFQVTGLENVFRDDVVNKEKMFTQEEALANAAAQHDGYFVVPAVIDND